MSEGVAPSLTPLGLAYTKGQTTEKIGLSTPDILPRKPVTGWAILFFKISQTLGAKCSRDEHHLYNKQQIITGSHIHYGKTSKKYTSFCFKIKLIWGNNNQQKLWGKWLVNAITGNNRRFTVYRECSFAGLLQFCAVNNAISLIILSFNGNITDLRGSELSYIKQGILKKTTSLL